MTPENSPMRRRLFQFGLGTLFVIVTVLGACAGSIKEFGPTVGVGFGIAVSGSAIALLGGQWRELGWPIMGVGIFVILFGGMPTVF